ncbi:hypothetical protein L7F22_000392 [Adiantum nelumboides]|nr:hypothetical protein [Adiantum nelumboides]
MRAVRQNAEALVMGARVLLWFKDRDGPLVFNRASRVGAGVIFVEVGVGRGVAGNVVGGKEIGTCGGVGATSNFMVAKVPVRSSTENFTKLLLFCGALMSGKYVDDLKKILEDFQDVFLKDLSSGLLPSPHVDNGIDVMPGSKPISKPAYRLSHFEAQEVKNQWQGPSVPACLRTTQKSRRRREELFWKSQGVLYSVAGRDRAQCQAKGKERLEIPRACGHENSTSLPPTANVLPDGRVLVAGSNPNVGYAFVGVKYATELRIEAYHPYYLDFLNNGLRPVVTYLSKREIGYGSIFTVEFAVKSTPKDVEFRVYYPPFTTHTYSMSQRQLVLAASPLRTLGAHFYARVTAPPNSIAAPSGYYLLFVTNAGIPSGGLWVRFA